MTVCPECGQHKRPKKYTVTDKVCENLAVARSKRACEQPPKVARISVVGSIHSVLAVLFENEQGTFVAWKP